MRFNLNPLGILFENFTFFCTKLTFMKLTGQKIKVSFN